MRTDNPINTLVLQEFRLHAADSAGEAARIVASFSDGIEPAVPLLTSIEDDCDVAIVRGLHAGEQQEGDPRQRAALDPLVASWQPVKQYGPRITERSESPSTYYRLAVTESVQQREGRNARAGPAGLAMAARRNVWASCGSVDHRVVRRSSDVLGSDERDARSSEPREWPLLPLSRSLGVRIYESQ